MGKHKLPRSFEHCQKISQRMKVSNPSLGGLKEAHRKKISESEKRAYSEGRHKRFHTAETRKKISESVFRNCPQRGKKLTPEEIAKRLRKHPMSSFEKAVDKLIVEYALPYRFVGNGDLIVAGKCPDFVCTIKKIVVEVFYTKHKDMFRGDHKEWMKEREQIFATEGFKTVFIDESMMKNLSRTDLAGNPLKSESIWNMQQVHDLLVGAAYIE